MRSRRIIVGAVSVCLGFLVVGVSAEELERMDAKVARKMAEQLCRQAKQLKNLQLHIDPDLTRAEGVHRERDAGLIIVPQHGLTQESRAIADAVKREPGAALGYLFAYRIVPVIEGKPIAVKRLRRVTMTNESGGQVEVSCMLLAVRQLAGENWRLNVYGAERKPLVDVPFAAGSGSDGGPLAFACKNIKGFEGDLIVTVLERYHAQFKVRYQPE